MTMNQVPPPSAVNQRAANPIVPILATVIWLLAAAIAALPVLMSVMIFDSGTDNAVERLRHNAVDWPRHHPSRAGWGLVVDAVTRSSRFRGPPGLARDGLAARQHLVDQTVFQCLGRR